MLRFFPVLAAASVLVAACGDLGSGSGLPHDDSSLSMSVIVASVPDPNQPAALIGQCLARTPTLDTTGTPACVVIEGRHTGGACSCDASATRAPVTAAHAGALDMAKASTQAGDLVLDCFCEVPFVTGPAADACRNDATEPPEFQGQPIDGICYVDASLTPSLGNPELTKACLLTEKRLMRFAGAGQPAPTEATGPVAMFIVCESDVAGDTAAP